MPRYIDADALVDEVMERYCKNCDRRKGIKNGKYRIARDIATIIENEKDMRVILQNADRTAAWIPEPDRRNHWHCSKCGYVIGILKMDAKYCLNCGCQMQEGEENG